MFGPQVLDRTGRLLARAEPARRRADPHRPRGRADPGRRARRAEDDAVLAARARAGSPRPPRTGWSRAGRALEHLPAVAAAFAAGRGHRRAGGGDRPGRPRRSTGPPPPRRAWTWPAVDAALADVAATRPHAELAQVVHHYLARLDPDGPEPDPTEGRRLTIVQHPDGSRDRPRSTSTRSAGRRCRPRWSRSCRPTGPPGDMRTRAQQLGRRVRAVGRQHPGRRATCRSCAPSSRTWSSPSTSTTSPTRTPAPAPRTHRLRRADLRRPGPLAGLRRQHHPHRDRPRRAAAGRRPRPSGSFPPHIRRAVERPRPALRVRRLLRPHPLVRRPPRPANGSRRRADLGGQRRPALRTPPHQGPPRVPDRTTTRRPMAHLPPRRHRDPACPNRYSSEPDQFRCARPTALASACIEVGSSTP